MWISLTKRQMELISSQVNDIILPNPKSRGAYSYSTYYVPGKDSLDVFKAPEVVDGNFPF